MSHHKVWDSLIVVDREYAWGRYVARSEKEYLANHDAEEMAAGSLIDWANECHAAALTVYLSSRPT